MLWQSDILRLSISNKYDVVIFLGDMHYISTWISLIFRNLMRKKSALWTIGMHRPAFRFNLLVRKLWFLLPSKIFLYGEYGRSLLSKVGVRENRMCVIFNSLDFERQSAIYQEAINCEHQTTDVPLIVSMGRVTERRNLNRLIEATALLRERGRDIQVRIIGNGPALPRLEALAAALGVTDRVHFLGAIYDEEVLASHLTAANVCVVPGVIGLGVVHAHTYGCPVITCGDMAIQAPEVEVMSPGVTGLFCDWDDSVSVANQIERWLSDGRTKAAIREACRARVEACWTPAFQRAAIETAIEQLLPAQRA
jgi:glycosyltransferase involved in cell wall biosynthesis